jgi:hypothetical protein
MGGCFCKMSVTVNTVFWTHSGYSNLQGFICKVAVARASARGPAPVPCTVGPPGLKSAQVCLLFFLFFFWQDSNNSRKWYKNPKNVKPISLVF